MPGPVSMIHFRSHADLSRPGKSTSGASSRPTPAPTSNHRPYTASGSLRGISPACRRQGAPNPNMWFVMRSSRETLAAPRSAEIRRESS
ncbi:hypothetical protein K402DRAFT_392347 [Aulographum hederae CBS 113979]|uniref:Uncharacterized protein n=1 Tax=Aulographum hederae CBS 113979 TaxID=1176131 RepID=A0A6G1H4J5_9PEZI|nr:hypothetical protein K402DRAFT_392347 [Aulographum hederae CBS 113979]